MNKLTLEQIKELWAWANKNAAPIVTIDGKEYYRIMSQCRSCGQKIDWVKTTKGKNMPVDDEYIDYEEADNGTILVTDGGMVVTVNEHQKMPSVRGRISHFATCPQADRWRK